MRAKITYKGQITIPIEIRKRLNLKVGQELEFDEQAPYLRATKVVDEKAMRSAFGCLKKVLKSTEIEKVLDDTRGKVELP